MTSLASRPVMAVGLIARLALVLGLLALLAPNALADDGDDGVHCNTTVTADGTFNGTWTTDCKASNYEERGKRYARYYSFEVTQLSGVTIDLNTSDLKSSQNPFLRLRQGKDVRTGTPLHYNDNAGESQNPPGTALIWDSRISEGLSPGWYTIEATTLDTGANGTFQLTISGLDSQASVPVISIASGSDVTEGTDASFTLTASPTPAADLDVTVNITQDGDFLTDADFLTTAPQTVTISTTGSATLAVATDDDSIAESDGAVTVTMLDGTGYAVSSSIGSGMTTLNVADDDTELSEPVCTVTLTADGSVSGEWVADEDCKSLKRLGRNARFYSFEFEQSSEITIDLKSADEDTYMYLRSGKDVRGGPHLHEDDDGGGSLDSRISETLKPGWYTIEATTYRSRATGEFSLTISGLPPQAAEPEVTIAAGGGVIEGAAASFTLTAAPAPAAGLDVTVTVSQAGDYGATTGARTVTIPTSGSYTLTVATTDDTTDEPDGSVTATIDSGTGYTVSTTNSAATVAVSDDDVPEIAIAAGGGVTEGTAATFTVTADPTPHTALSVDVTISQSGAFAATTGARTVTIPTSGSYTLTVATTDDTTDEPDGSVTATIDSGTGYTVSTTSSAATVAMSDDDDPSPVVSIAGGSAVTEGGNATFTLTATPEPTAPLSVKVTVSQSGDFYSATGQMTVQMATSGSHTLRIGTTNDSADEPDGSITVTLATGTGYTVSSSAGVATVVVTDDDVPEIAIAAGGGVTEGTAATFTVTADPTPHTALSVDVTISQSGAFAATTGARTVTIPTSGSYTLTVATTDDTTDEPDGSVTATIDSGTGYTVSTTSSAATVAVSDDDDSSATCNLPADAVSVAEVTGWRDQYSAATHQSRWNRVLEALGEDTGSGESPMTAAQARDIKSRIDNSRWDRTVRTLEALSQCDAPPPPATPEISIASDGDVTEGGTASFTITASPAPTAGLSVSVTVSQSGDFASTGSRTVTIPTSGSYTLTVATTNDTTDEADGSVTATLGTGTGYTVSSNSGAATVAVSDNDVPEITIAAGGGVTEGTAATFTLTADPTPHTALSVEVTISQNGALGATTGSRTVTIPTSGSYTLTVATTNDSTDEPDGSVTATIDTGTGYTVSTTAGTATVAVSDDDDDPVPDDDTAVQDCVSDSLLGTVRHYYDVNQDRPPNYGENWKRVLIAFGDAQDALLSPYTAAEARQSEQRWSGWKPVREALECIDTARDQTPPPPPPPEPEIAVAAGGGVIEGAAASFTLTASPEPAAGLDVSVTVTQSGDYGATTGCAHRHDPHQRQLHPHRRHHQRQHRRGRRISHRHHRHRNRLHRVDHEQRDRRGVRQRRARDHHRSR